MITIIAIGKKHEPWVLQGIERYLRRLKPPFNVQWQLLPHSALSGDQARVQESERILARIKPEDYVILLDERGTLLDSPAVASMCNQAFVASRNLVLVIGGAYGVDGTVHQRANVEWSLSRLVFPHQLVRLILAEQLYRAQEIAAGRPYHHE